MHDLDWTYLVPTSLYLSLHPSWRVPMWDSTIHSYRRWQKQLSMMNADRHLISISSSAAAAAAGLVSHACIRSRKQIFRSFSFLKWMSCSFWLLCGGFFYPRVHSTFDQTTTTVILNGISHAWGMLTPQGLRPFEAQKLYLHGHAGWLIGWSACGVLRGEKII